MFAVTVSSSFRVLFIRIRVGKENTDYGVNRESNLMVLKM